MSISTLEKLTKEELSNMVHEYQNRFENMMASVNAELSSLRDRFTKMESQLLVTRRVNRNLLKQNHILGKKCAANEWYPGPEWLEMSRFLDSLSNNNLEETILKIFDEAGVTIDSRDIKACHRLNEPACLKKVIIKISKRNDVAKVMNNKNKLKSMKPQNIDLLSSCKIFINESLCKYFK